MPVWIWFTTILSPIWEKDCSQDLMQEKVTKLNRISVSIVVFFNEIWHSSNFLDGDLKPLLAYISLG